MRTRGAHRGPTRQRYSRWSAPRPTFWHQVRTHRPVALLAATALLGLGAVAAYAAGGSSHHHLPSASRPTPPLQPVDPVGSTVAPAPTPTVDTTNPAPAQANANANANAAAAAAAASAMRPLFRTAASGVADVDATTCAGTGSGSGVLIAPTLVLTAAHVVDEPVSVGVTVGRFTSSASVVGLDESADLALLRTVEPLPGRALTIGTKTPSAGEVVGLAANTPSGDPVFITGEVRSGTRTITVAGARPSGLLSVAAIIPGASAGGPVLDRHGQVAGIVDTSATHSIGPAFAVPAPRVQALLSEWQADPAAPARGSCPAPTGPPTSGLLGNAALVPTGIAAVLTTYFNGVDSGNYPLAYAQLGPAERASFDESFFVSQDLTSYDYGLTVAYAHPTGADGELVGVDFTSLQSPSEGPAGASCDEWTLQYDMVQSGGGWLINGTTGQGGSTARAC